MEELAQLRREPWWQNPEPRPRGLAHVPGVARPACEVVAIIQQPARLGLMLPPLPFHAVLVLWADPCDHDGLTEAGVPEDGLCLARFCPRAQPGGWP